MCVDAMGKLMMTNHWPLEAGIIIGEQKANVKAEYGNGGPVPISRRVAQLANIYSSISP